MTEVGGPPRRLRRHRHDRPATPPGSSATGPIGFGRQPEILANINPGVHPWDAVPAAEPPADDADDHPAIARLAKGEGPAAVSGTRVDGRLIGLGAEHRVSVEGARVERDRGCTGQRVEGSQASRCGSARSGVGGRPGPAEGRQWAPRRGVTDRGDRAGQVGRIGPELDKRKVKAGAAGVIATVRRQAGDPDPGPVDRPPAAQVVRPDDGVELACLPASNTMRGCQHMPPVDEHSTADVARPGVVG